MLGRTELAFASYRLGICLTAVIALPVFAHGAFPTIFDNAIKRVPRTEQHYDKFDFKNLHTEAPHTQLNPFGVSNSTLQAFRKWGFGMVSYYDTFTNPEGQNNLIRFVKKYNITFINQYVCADTLSSQFADFVNRIHGDTGAHVNILFDDTLVSHSTGSTCDIPCERGKSTPKGYCCGSVARKFAWLRDVISRLQNRQAINGAAFDIEGLTHTDFMRLFQTMRTHWNETIVKQGGDHQMLRWYFGSGLGAIAADAVRAGLIDQILWENYANSKTSYATRASRVLEPLNATLRHSDASMFANGPPVALISETNCCQKPCANGNHCQTCKTVSLPARQEISFCSLNKIPGSSSHKMNVDYMLSVMESGMKSLRSAGYKKLLFRPIIYDYRALHILLEGTDAPGAQLCPKVKDEHSSRSTAAGMAHRSNASFFGVQPKAGGPGFRLLV